MTRQDAEQITTAYCKRIYGFALKWCRNLQDAEDLSQEIVMKVFRAFLSRDDIENPEKFIWTLAHNALSNYYRDRRREVVGLSAENAAENDLEDDLILRESAGRLQSEIAYLSQQQRRIVIAYYYENKKQSDIAAEMGLPLGTVKWHLFEAKKELKRGMETMRQHGELKFNPIHFTWCGTSGSIGSKGTNTNFFRSALSQNIAYAVRNAAKTVNEIADELGVSPVYVESEAAYLEEYGFLTKQGEKYGSNMLIEEYSEERNRVHDAVYRTAAKLFANELYDELLQSDIWNDPALAGGCTEPVSFEGSQPKDRNFFLWALIPYIAAVSGEDSMDCPVSFSEAATVRPDGGQNICCATVLNPNVTPPEYTDSMKNWYGPAWTKQDGLTLWRIDSEWSGRRIDDAYHFDEWRILKLLHQELGGVTLSEEDYAYLAELGLVKTIGSTDEMFKSAWQCVWIEGSEMKNKLIAIGDSIKERHRAEFDELRRQYTEAVLKEIPPHLHRMARFGLQYTFYADGWFILHCLQELVGNGKLQPPNEEQKKALTTILIHE